MTTNISFVSFRRSLLLLFNIQDPHRSSFKIYVEIHLRQGPVDFYSRRDLSSNLTFPVFSPPPSFFVAIRKI